MAAAAVLKITKILICHQRFDRVSRNLTLWCKMGILTALTVKKFEFQKSKMADGHCIATIADMHLLGCRNARDMNGASSSSSSWSVAATAVLAACMLLYRLAATAGTSRLQMSPYVPLHLCCRVAPANCSTTHAVLRQ